MPKTQPIIVKSHNFVPISSLSWSLTSAGPFRLYSLNFGLSGGGFSCVFVHELERNRPNSVIFPRILGHFRLTSCNSVQLRAGFVFKRNRRLTPLGVVLTNLNSPALGGNGHFRLNSGDTNLNFRPTSWAPPKFVSSA